LCGTTLAHRLARRTETTRGSASGSSKPAEDTRPARAMRSLGHARRFVNGAARGRSDDAGALAREAHGDSRDAHVVGADRHACQTRRVTSASQYAAIARHDHRDAANAVLNKRGRKPDRRIEGRRNGARTRGVWVQVTAALHGTASVSRQADAGSCGAAVCARTRMVQPVVARRRTERPVQRQPQCS
jgi:hypothetical protein